MKLYIVKNKLSPGLLLLLAVVVMQSGCKPSDHHDYYTPHEFASVKKIDVHAHALVVRPGLVQQAKEDNFILVSLNTDVPDYLPVDSQQAYVLQLRQNYPDNIFYVSAFETVGINEPGWSDRQLAYLKKSFDSGALGIKCGRI